MYSGPVFLIVVFMIVALLISTVAVSYLYVKDRKQRDVIFDQAQETKKRLDQLQVALAQGDLKKAFTELASAQKNISGLLPGTSQTQTKPEIAAKKQPSAPADAGTSAPQTTAATPSRPTPGAVAKKVAPVAIAPAALTIAADEAPLPLVHAEEGEYVLVCEKDRKTLHLFRYSRKKFVLTKSYPCIVGANDFDKKREGDLATPVGAYFFLRYTPGRALPEKYGHGAFVLNYPNFIDRKYRRQGTGIWLHGHTPGKNLGDDELENTRGCIVVGNDVLKELASMLPANGVPIVIVNRLESSKLLQQQQVADELTGFMKSWGKAWESANSKSFMSHYAADFINSEGMNYQAFKLQKEKVNRGKKFIRVGIENQAILLSREKDGQIAVLRFNQRYRSNNFNSDTKKIFYLRRGETGWQIFGESKL